MNKGLFDQKRRAASRKGLGLHTVSHRHTIHIAKNPYMPESLGRPVKFVPTVPYIYATPLS